MASPEVDSITVTIPTHRELRVMLTQGQQMTFTLTSGQAQFFGWNLPLQETIKYSDQPFAIFSQQACNIRITGTYSSYYVSDSTFYSVYERIVNKSVSSIGGKHTILVTGAPMSGKTSFCRWISNLLLEKQPQTKSYPLYINLDPAQPLFSPPGCISALPVGSHITNFGFPFIDPLVYFYGHDDVVQDRLPLFIDQMKELAGHVIRRCREGRDGPVIIDFPAVKNELFFEILTNAIESFNVTHVYILGDDGLQKRIRRFKSTVITEKLPMMPGVAQLERSVIRRIRHAQTSRYFDGDPSKELNPSNHTYLKSQFPLLSLGSAAINKDGSFDPKKAVTLPLSASMLTSRIVAVVGTCIHSELWKQNALGFLRVMSVDENEDTILVVKPNQFDIPGAFYVVGSVKASFE